MTGMAKGGTAPRVREFGIQPWSRLAHERQIEAARIAMTATSSAAASVDQRVPDKPISRNPPRPHGLRQGQPGEVGAVVKPGRVLFELSGVPNPSRVRRCGSRSTASDARRFIVREEEV